MKKIVCEMCGSNDLLKKDGVFECQSCGTKYSVEEAKKMMVDGTVNVEGTVKIDSSNKIDNLIKNGKTLYKDGKYDEAYSLFGEVLNIDPENYVAIAYRGLCSAWKTTVKNPLIGDALTGLARSFALAKEALDETKEYANFSIEISDEIFKIGKACINLYVNYMHESYDNLNERIKELNSSLSSAGLYADVNFYRRQGEQAQNRNKQEIITGKQGLKLTLTTVTVTTLKVLDVKDINIFSVKQYKNIRSNIDNCLAAVNGWVTDDIKDEWTKVMAAGLMCDDKIKAVSQQMRDKYWKEHTEEKEKLEKEIADEKAKIKDNVNKINDLKKEKSALEEKINATVPSESELKTLNKKEEKLKEEKSNLGLFKLKDRKAVQEKIDAIEEDIEKVNKKIEKEKKELANQYEPDMTKIESKIDKLDKEIEKSKKSLDSKEQKLNFGVDEI